MPPLPSAYVGDEIPREIVAGDSYEWLVPIGPWSGWTPAYVLKSASNRVEISGANITIDGSTWRVVLPSATSDDLTAGIPYRWFLTVALSGDKRVVANGWLSVVADPRAAGGADYRTHARKMLDAIRTLLEGKPLKGDQTAYAIADRSIQRYTPAELTEWERVYASRVRQEERAEAAARGESDDRMVEIAFVE